MVLHLLKTHFRRLALARRQADELIAQHGEQSWSIARARAFDAPRDTERSDLAWDVVCQIEWRLGVDWQPETATLYLLRRSGECARWRAS